MSTNDAQPASKQYIRNPAAAWNAYVPHYTRSRQFGFLQKPKLKLKLKLNFRLPDAQSIQAPGACHLQESTTRNSNGTTRDNGTDTSPWQIVEQRKEVQRPSIEPLSPEIDPRILDGSWRTYVPTPIASPFPSPSPSLGSPIHTPVLTRVEKPIPFFFPGASTTSPPLPSSPSPSYDIFLPTPLVNTTIASAPARTVWRTEPHKRLTARLKVGCRLGELIKAREKKERKRAYDREYRARKKQKLMLE